MSRVAKYAWDHMFPGGNSSGGKLGGMAGVAGVLD